MRLIRIMCIAAVVAPFPSGAQAAPIPDWPIAAGGRQTDTRVPVAVPVK